MGCCCTLESNPISSLESKSSLSEHHRSSVLRAPLLGARLSTIEEEDHDYIALEKSLDEIIADLERDEFLFTTWHRDVLRKLRIE